eukprot:5863992-Pleurochrysis_carterae.AAC.1
MHVCVVRSYCSWCANVRMRARACTVGCARVRACLTTCTYRLECGHASVGVLERACTSTCAGPSSKRSGPRTRAGKNETQGRRGGSWQGERAGKRETRRKDEKVSEQLSRVTECVSRASRWAGAGWEAGRVRCWMGGRESAVLNGRQGEC